MEFQATNFSILVVQSNFDLHSAADHKIGYMGVMI